MPVCVCVRVCAREGGEGGRGGRGVACSMSGNKSTKFFCLGSSRHGRKLVVARSAAMLQKKRQRMRVLQQQSTAVHRCNRRSMVPSTAVQGLAVYNTQCDGLGRMLQGSTTRLQLGERWRDFDTRNYRFVE